MRFTEVLKLACESIWSHKLRSGLTLLGLVIGITAVAVIVSLIQGFNAYVDEKIAGIGSNAFTIRRFGFDDLLDTDALLAAQRRNKDLTLEDFEHLRAHAKMSGVGAKAMPTSSQLRRDLRIVFGTSVEGATANCAELEGIDVADGRYFVPAEDETAKRVAFIGDGVARKLFGHNPAVDREIKINGIPYRVVGVAAARGAVFGVSQDDFVTIPLTTYANNFGSLKRHRALYLVAKARSDETFAEAVEEARVLLRARRRLGPGEKDNFGIITPDAIKGVRDRVLGPVYVVAVAVPSISLAVGGIVIMNVMLVSVGERTKEIGLRKALGARRRDILKQFLVEAVVLSACGGLAGVVLAWVGSRLVDAYFFPSYLSLLAVGLAFAVSSVIGMLSGAFPAWKAARLDPIEALHVE
ncbi:MAG TPA: ABC transporter permease [Pyrinomonadaceae bacterium]|nr:ABC transporter permease [Pyrinomonadaceae bacterium]